MFLNIATLIFDWIGILIPILPTYLGVKYFRKLPLNFRSIAMVMLTATLVSFYSKWQAINGTNNLPSLHLLTIVEYILVSFFFYFTFNSRAIKSLVIVLLIAFTIFFSLNTLYIQDIYTYNTYSRGLEALLICFLCLLYFYQLVKEDMTVPLTKIPEFWVVAGLLVFFSFIQLYSMFFYYLAVDLELNKALMRILKVASIIYYPLVGVGIWKKSLA